MLISIEGNIGTGKTTLFEILKDHYKDNPNIIFISEPVDKWIKLTDTDGENILEKFYKDQSRWSYSFQMHAFITRSKEILNYHTSDKIIISERSVLTDHNVFADLLHKQNKISELEWKLYIEWFNWLTDTNPEIKPDKYIYLKADPNISYERIKKRTRAEESNIPLEYIKDVSNQHDNWLLNIESKKTTEISLNNDFVKDRSFRHTLLKEMTDIIDSDLKKIIVNPEHTIEDLVEITTY